MNLDFLSSDILKLEYFGNTVAEYLYALGFFVLLLVVFGVFQYYILQRLKKIADKTKTDIDDTVIQIMQGVNPPFYSFLAFYFSLKLVSLHEWAEKVMYVVLMIWLIYLIIHAVQVLIDYVFRKTIAKDDDRGSRSALATIKNVLKGVLWAIGVLLILSNLGFDINALIASLGIGGLAVALAAQNILSDLFSSFAIMIDKPFVPGDFIVVGEHKGIVEKIGIKTTRIRALQGEEIVISNQELTSTRVQNFKKMKERRVVFKFGVVYEIKSDSLEDIPKIAEKIIEKQKGARFDRTHFMNFDDSALVFESVYYVATGDYQEYADIHQAILFAMKREFEEHKIDMAYPTQTLYVHK